MQKSWADPARTSDQPSEELPGLYLTVEKDHTPINYITSKPYNGVGNYTLRTYFDNIPKFGETVELTFDIKDENGKLIAEHPQTNESWSYIWW
jgi:hypothetical protein